MAKACFDGAITSTNRGSVVSTQCRVCNCHCQAAEEFFVSVRERNGRLKR